MLVWWWPQGHRLTERPHEDLRRRRPMAERRMRADRSMSAAAFGPVNNVVFAAYGAI